MTDKITSFVIDRALWLRGGGAKSTSCLLNDEGKRCCLGFYGKACGLTDGMQLHTADPEQLDLASKKALGVAGASWLFQEDEYRNTNSGTTNNLIFENDSRYSTDEKREAVITRIFAENGITVTFIN